MENLQKEFVTYNQALRLKALGFNEPCLLNVWWLNDKCTITKKLFEPLISINGNDIDFEYSLPKKHPLEKWGAIDIDIPTFSVAFRWFREKHNLFHSVDRIFKDEFGYTITPGDNEPINCFNFNDWDSAESNCLDKLIEIVEPKERQ